MSVSVIRTKIEVVSSFVIYIYNLEDTTWHPTKQNVMDDTMAQKIIRCSTYVNFFYILCEAISWYATNLTMDFSHFRMRKGICFFFLKNTVLSYVLPLFYTHSDVQSF